MELLPCFSFDVSGLGNQIPIFVVESVLLLDTADACRSI